MLTLLACSPIGGVLVIPSRAGSLKISTIECDGDRWTRVASDDYGVRHYPVDLSTEVAKDKFCSEVGR